MTTLENAHGADVIMQAAADLALFFVGEPDDRVNAVLLQVQANLQDKLSLEVGAEMAAVLATAFVQDVLGRRAKIESNRAGLA